MVIDEKAPDLHRLFKRYNRQYFGGTLSLDRINLVWDFRLKFYLGFCHFKIVNGKNHADRIRIAYRPLMAYGFKRNHIREILIHEMCHAYIMQRYGSNQHCKRFNNKMRKILKGKLDSYECVDSMSYEFLRDNA